MATMKSVLSIGFGRLHLVTASGWLAQAGADIDLVCGWIPRNPDGALVRLCSRMIGRDLSSGMRKRAIRFPGVTVRSQPVVDFLDQGLRLLDRKLFHGRHRGAIAARDWRLFGSMSRRYLPPRSNPPAIFHVRSGAGQGGAIAAAKRRGMKVVVDHSIAHPGYLDSRLRDEYLRNGAAFDLGLDSPFWRIVLRDCEEADIVQVNSFFVRDTFVEAGFDPARIRVVYLGEREDFFGLRVRRIEDAAQMAPPAARPPLRLLFTGGFSFRKGAEYLLDACRILQERGVAFTLDVVGDASGARRLIARHQAEKLPVTYYGFRPQDELKSFLADSDVYVFPSLAEGCAQSGMEAMSAGLCVVGTRESGFPITDGKDGFLVPARDARAIADRVQWLDAHRGEIDRVGRNAAELIRAKYTWRQYAGNTLDIYRELLA